MVGRYILTIPFLLFYIWSANGFIKTIPLPESLSECFERKTRHLNVTDFPGHAINSFCVNTYKSRNVDVNQKLDVPQEILDWIQSLLRKFISTRHKRQTSPRRIRKEIRALTETERYNYFRAILDLKADTSIAPNKYDALARFHSGNLTIANAHDSSNFFGWHRVFLIIVEEALRTKNPHVTIPYWDSTKDFEMSDPVMSVLWTSQFFGNGDGIVTTGPFANWITGDNEPLIRNIGSSGSLMSRQGIQNILSRTFHYQINEGTAAPEDSLEIQHNAVHNWVDGTMAGLNTAPQDPAFYSHHSFIDYIWYVFRRQQVARGINPANDYPPTNNTFHQPFFRMVGFEPLRNIDGYSNFWDEIVSYEDTPICSSTGDCNSQYLDCMEGTCVSKDASAVNELPGGQMGSMSPSMIAARKLGPLPIGKRFPYYFIDHRTRGDPLKTRKLKKQKQKRIPTHNIMTMMNGLSSNDMRPVGVILHNALSSWRLGNTAIQKQNTVHGKVSRSKPGTQSVLDQSFQNTFLMDGVADINRWVYIPVRIIHSRPNGQSFQAKLIQNGHITNMNDMFTPSLYKDLQKYINSGSPATYNKCPLSASGATKIFIQSDGISYTGRYKDYTVIDGRQPITSAVAYIALKNPKLGLSQAYLSAYDLCGRMCKPRCLVSGSSPPQYEPCSGAIHITEEFPKMYGQNYGEAVTGMWDLRNKNCPNSFDGHIHMVFYCDYDNIWPWQKCNTNFKHS